MLLLHILNDAWASILIKQAITNSALSVLFVAADEDEAMYFRQIARRLIPDDIDVNLSISTVGSVICSRSYATWRSEEFPAFDDILISHEVHDVMLLDFLSRHCKRKVC